VEQNSIFMLLLTNKENKNNIDYALHYRKIGLNVIPVQRNKKPYLESWKKYQSQLSSESEIIDWWNKWPEANIAIVTGKISGIVVLDIDIKHKRSSKEFKLPVTACAKSGSGGEHFFFKYPNNLKLKNGAGVLGDGVDIRSDGGYILVAPSENESGLYEWIIPIEEILADVPEWLLETSNSKNKKWESGLNGISEGSRNETATSMSGKILSTCPKELWDTIGFEQLQIWNNKNTPPLLDSELKTVWNSVKKYHDDNILKPRENQADKIVGLIQENKNITLFRSELDEPYICFPVENHKEYWALKDRRTKWWIASEYWKKYGKSPSGDSISTALNILQGIAIFGANKFTLSNRVAFKDDNVFYSLSNDNWEAVKISRDGWKLESNVPILFRRQGHQTPQVYPREGGNINDIFKYINVKNEQDKILFLVWLISSFIPDFPHPILYLYGPQGSAKSTSSKFVKKINDPSKVETSEIPKDQKELVQKLSHNWCLIFDNISSVSQDLSDILCRAVTGSGFSKRELYSDDSDVIYTFKRCISINGINLLALKPDLLERSILIELDRVSKTDRRNEQDLIKEFESNLPSLLGAIFDVIVKAIQIRPSVVLKDTPRMADFAMWGYAIAEAIGCGGEVFIKHYFQNINLQNNEVIEENPIASFVVSLVEKTSYWENSASELLKLIKFDIDDKALPNTPQELSRQLNILRTNLEEIGIIVEFVSGRKRKIIIRKKGETSASTASLLQDNTLDK